MADRFKQIMKQIHEMLADNYGEYVAHALDFKKDSIAENYLKSLSFTTGRKLQNFDCPDRIKIATVLLPNGVFLILGGQFTTNEHEEIRIKADKYGVECNSTCIADDGSKLMKDFMDASDRLKEENTRFASSKKWWQIWK